VFGVYGLRFSVQGFEFWDKGFKVEDIGCLGCRA
jgi:hypothetical protein